MPKTTKIPESDMERISDMICALSRSFSMRFSFLEYDDLVQEGWRIFHERHLSRSYRKDKAKATTWLFSVFRNHYSNIVTKERRAVHTTLEHGDEHFDDIAMPSESCSARDLMNAFRTRLSPLCYEMLECLIDHVDVRRVWEAQGVSVSHRSYCCLMDELRSTASHVAGR